MDIQAAKEEIRNTLRAYLQKDPDGNYCYPTVRQRPLLLMGPPGVGKTAIVEQAAREAGLPLVAYTMTHHTRQSAVGLPKIEERDYCGQHFSITEYTMSEIIGAVYAAMEHSGKREGILFLDEINCVSDTLAPTMLQFLQNKMFGNHALPQGWAIVAAGNPPEYNKSVRDFDIVTLDRIRNIPVEANVEAFLSYSAAQGLHGAVLSYLGLKKEKFYHVSRDETSLHYVTARGWEDLSRLLQSYEGLNLPVDEALIGEFLNLEETARDFYAFYQLYRKYGRDYGVPELLSGAASPETWQDRAALARAGDFTERFTLVNQILVQLRETARNYARVDALDVTLHEILAAFLRQRAGLDDFLDQRRKALDTKAEFRLTDRRAMDLEKRALEALAQWSLEAKKRRLSDRESLDAFLKTSFEAVLPQRTQAAAQVCTQIDRAIDFLTDCFGDGQELTLLLSGITGTKELMDCIARHGCESYLKLSERLLCQKNEQALQQECIKAVKQKLQ